MAPFINKNTVLTEISKYFLSANDSSRRQKKNCQTSIVFQTYVKHKDGRLPIKHLTKQSYYSIPRHSSVMTLDNCYFVMSIVILS